MPRIEKERVVLKPELPRYFQLLANVLVRLKPKNIAEQREVHLFLFEELPAYGMQGLSLDEVIQKIMELNISDSRKNGLIVQVQQLYGNQTGAVAASTLQSPAKNLNR